MTAPMKLDIYGNIVPMTANDIASRPKPETAAGSPQSVLSPTQFAIVLHRRGVITAEEAEEFAASGAIPPALDALIDSALAKAGLPENERVEIRIKLRGELEYHRSAAAVPIIGTAVGLDAAALDKMWIEGASV